MKLSEALPKIYQTHWSYTNTFHCDINWTNENMCSALKWDEECRRNFALNVVSFQTPDFVTTPIEVFTADEWILGDSAPELWRFSINIKDQDCVKYHRTFIKAKALQQKLYFDDYKCIITLYKDADYLNEQDTPIFQFEECMIESVGAITFDTSAETEILTFPVNFKSAKPLFNDN